MKAWRRAATFRLFPEDRISLGSQARILTVLMGPNPGMVSSKALALGSRASGRELFDLLIQCAQTLSQGGESLQDGEQGRTTGRGQLGIGHRSLGESFKPSRFGTEHPIALQRGESF